MKNIERLLKEMVQKGQTPSVQYVFFDTTSTVYEFCYGVKNVGTGNPVRTDSTYNLFSITKTLTALAALQLAESGKITLDQHISDFLVGIKFNKPVTIKHLLNHTAGLVNPFPLNWIHLADASYNKNKFHETVFKSVSKPQNSPGAAFSYSNLGYILLGEIIEKASGVTYEEYIQKHIIGALGIPARSLGFTLTPSLHATGYQRWFSFTHLLLRLLIKNKKVLGDREGAWQPFRNFYVNGTAYGGLIGSACGLLKYGQALLRNDNPILGSSSREILFRENNIDGRKTGMACSWFTGKLLIHSYVAHAGGGGGYYSELRLYPDLEVGSLILFNRTGLRDERILDKTDRYFIS